MDGLREAAACKHGVNFFCGMLQHIDPLHLVQFLDGGFPAVFSGKKPGVVIADGGVGRDRQQRAPVIGFIAGFFPELSFGGAQGGFRGILSILLFNGTGGELSGDLPDAVPELADAQELSFLIRGDNHDVVPAGKTVIRLENPAVWGTVGGFAEVNPLVLDDMLCGDFLPGKVFFFHYTDPFCINRRGLGTTPQYIVTMLPEIRKGEQDWCLTQTD